MTFEERIDRLTERHEALAQTVELIARNNLELQSSMVEMRMVTKHNSEMLGDLLQAVSQLVQLAGQHENRISKLEGR